VLVGAVEVVVIVEVLDDVVVGVVVDVDSNVVVDAVGEAVPDVCVSPVGEDVLPIVPDEPDSSSSLVWSRMLPRSYTQSTARLPVLQSLRIVAPESATSGSQQMRAWPLACVIPLSASSSPAQSGQAPTIALLAVLVVGIPSTATAMISLTSAARTG